MPGILYNTLVFTLWPTLGGFCPRDPWYLSTVASKDPSICKFRPLESAAVAKDWTNIPGSTDVTLLTSDTWITLEPRTKMVRYV